MQWHPLFAELLRSVVEAYYEVQTNVPVGDVPREADIVLLRRRREGPLPFSGIWASLTTWNVLEFKSPNVRLRVDDIDLLVEVGLGVGRRLNEERVKRNGRPLEPRQVSFWLLANRLTDRFLSRCRRRVGRLAWHAPGIWRTDVLERPLFLVSNVHLPVDSETVPLHVVSREPYVKELVTAQLVLNTPALREIFEPWILALHERAWKEARQMAGLVDDEVPIDVKKMAEYIGIDRLIKQVGLKRVIAEVGLRQVIAEIGLGQVIAEVGLRGVLDEVGLDELLASLTAAERRELRRKLSDSPSRGR